MEHSQGCSLGKGDRMKNLDRLIRKLDKLGGNAHEAVKKGVGQATKLVQGDAKMLAPRDTGDLAQSIIESVTFDGDEVVGKVSTNIEWGSYVEFGTGQRGEASNYEGDVDLSYREDWGETGRATCMERDR